MNDLHDPRTNSAVANFYQALILLEQALRKAFPDIDGAHLRIVPAQCENKPAGFAVKPKRRKAVKSKRAKPAGQKPFTKQSA